MQRYQALLRLFFAHVDFPECPWLGMSTSTSPNEFKARVGEALDDGFKRDQIAGATGAGVLHQQGDGRCRSTPPVCQAENFTNRFTHELIKTKADGQVDGTNHELSVHDIPEEFHLRDGVRRSNTRKVDLPVRPEDTHAPSSSTLAYLPIVPRGYQRGSDRASATRPTD